MGDLGELDDEFGGGYHDVSGLTYAGAMPARTGRRKRALKPPRPAGPPRRPPLSAEEKAEVVRRVAAGESRVSVAAAFGVLVRTVGRAVRAAEKPLPQGDVLDVIVPR
jgi:transposase-like protein